MDPKDFASQLEALGALQDPVRRRLYLAVAGFETPTSRDAAARAAGVSRPLAAFHLDKLVEAGLLATSFRRLSGRTGPGAGRPSKLYVRSERQLDVSLPARRYELAAQMLARALTDTRSEGTDSALRSTARERGAAIGRDLRPRASRPPARPAPAPAASLRAASRALGRCGFEPSRTADGEVVLRNCPFASLREGCRDVICGMNLALIEGVLEGLGADHVSASLAPRPGHCCVVLRSDSPPRIEAAPSP